MEPSHGLLFFNTRKYLYQSAYFPHPFVMFMRKLVREDILFTLEKRTIFPQTRDNLIFAFRFFFSPLAADTASINCSFVADMLEFLTKFKTSNDLEIPFVYGKDSFPTTIYGDLRSSYETLANSVSHIWPFLLLPVIYIFFLSS